MVRKEQKNFLKNYTRPFTVLTDSKIIKMILNLEQEDFEYQNKEIYKKIAFRVAHNDIQKKLIKEIWPIFLTSANFSWEKEIYDINEAKKQFSSFSWISFLWENISLNKDTPPSDIIEFIWETKDFKKIR